MPTNLRSNLHHDSRSRFALTNLRGVNGRGAHSESATITVMPKVSPEQAYPGVAFQRRTRRWFARWSRALPECEHLATDNQWMALYSPDTLYLRGKSSALRTPPRPEVSICRACLLGLLEKELAAYTGRVVAFQPDGETFSQYFFVSREDFDAAGLEDDLVAAIGARLDALTGTCEECGNAARWLWLPHSEVHTLDETALVREAPGRVLCARHGAKALCRALEAVEEANLFYINAPYAEAGAYVWIA